MQAMPICKGTDPSFPSTDLSYRQRGKEKKKRQEEKKTRTGSLAPCHIPEVFFQSIHINGTTGDFQFLYHHCQEQANGASQRQTTVPATQGTFLLLVHSVEDVTHAFL